MTSDDTAPGLADLLNTALLEGLAKTWLEGPPSQEKAEQGQIAAFMLGGRLAERRPDIWVRYYESQQNVPAVSAMMDLMIQQLLELARLAEMPAPGLEGQAPPVGCEHSRVDRDGDKYICEDCGATLE